MAATHHSRRPTRWKRRSASSRPRRLGVVALLAGPFLHRAVVHVVEVGVAIADDRLRNQLRRVGLDAVRPTDRSADRHHFHHAAADLIDEDLHADHAVGVDRRRVVIECAEQAVLAGLVDRAGDFRHLASREQAEERREAAAEAERVHA